jgi:hypothetical protein
MARVLSVSTVFPRIADMAAVPDVVDTFVFFICTFPKNTSLWIMSEDGNIILLCNLLKEVLSCHCPAGPGSGRASSRRCFCIQVLLGQASGDFVLLEK